ncbi:outer membrane beta-barrel protein [Tenacibaculum amylolyticum]|uniref:outer membrane beta-barrel protein n=1 Tax=Tenacibaculum amylolyticum TaxID=104269 RepID=UPI0038954BA3
MKKFLLTIAMVAFGFAANAQDGQFNAGVNLGLPVGDASDISSFAVGAEVNYLFSVSDDFQVGPSVGFVNYFGKDTEVTAGGVTVTISASDAQFLPIAAAGRFAISDEFTLGADLGYAVGINTGNDGGFYYRPMVGYNVADNIMIQATYSGVSVTGGSVANIGLGVMFGL